MFKRTFSSLLFAFALLVAQQGGAWHALSHYRADLASSESDKSLPHSGQCAQCVAYAQTGAAAAATPFIFLTPSLSTERITHIGANVLAASDCPYQSQAPPHLA